jgi:hypothetical protein
MVNNCTSRSSRTQNRHELIISFTSHVLPPLPLTHIPQNCPLPTHPEASPYLMTLLGQTRQQLASADGRHLLDKGVSEMVRNLCESLQTELYASEDASRRLVDCLPEFNRWAKGVWEGIPDSGVEVSLHSAFNSIADLEGAGLAARVRKFCSTSVWRLGLSSG